MTFLDKLVGEQGIKTDVKVQVDIPDEFYYKTGATLALVGMVLFMAFFITKSLIK